MSANEVVYRYLVYLYLFQVTISLGSGCPSATFNRKQWRFAMFSYKPNWGLRENIERMKHYETS
jgi:hypothetical protein